MLKRFQNKKVRVTTEDGMVFAGAAEVFPSGMGLHEFGRAEESIRLGDTYIFLSDIAKVEVLSESGTEAADPRRFDDMMGTLLEGPYQVADILPEQVPAESGGQYFAVERYFLQPRRLRALRLRFAEILLRLNCYYAMAVSFDSCESWEEDPDPERFALRLADMSGNEFLRAVFPDRNAMIDIDNCDTFMTVYDPDNAISDKLRCLTQAEGLFLWRAPSQEL